MIRDDFVYTLVCDGTSDRALIPILDWLLTKHATIPFRGQWAANVPRGDLKRRAEVALALYPCDLLFIHRDAESEPYATRFAEIHRSVQDLNVSWVPVIPVRMTEAWLLGSESAIRAASGNPNGTINLSLPDVSRLETLPDPKERLFLALKTASELGARRLDRFNVFDARIRVSARTDDFSVLRALDAFRKLEIAIKNEFAKKVD